MGNYRRRDPSIEDWLAARLPRGRLFAVASAAQRSIAEWTGINTPIRCNPSAFPERRRGVRRRVPPPLRHAGTGGCRFFDAVESVKEGSAILLCLRPSPACRVSAQDMRWDSWCPDPRGRFAAGGCVARTKTASRVSTDGLGPALPRPQASVTDHEVASRAYELYLARSCEHGHDLDDWLQAERELQAKAPVA